MSANLETHSDCETQIPCELTLSVNVADIDAYLRRHVCLLGLIAYGTWRRALCLLTYSPNNGRAVPWDGPKQVLFPAMFVRRYPISFEAPRYLCTDQ